MEDQTPSPFLFKYSKEGALGYPKLIEQGKGKSLRYPGIWWQLSISDVRDKRREFKEVEMRGNL